MTSLTEPRSAATVPIFCLTMSSRNFRSRAYFEPFGRGKLVDLGRQPLAVAVDPADPLLKPGRVERDVEVDQAMAVILQVDALARRVGGDQHPHRVLVRRCGEPRADDLAVLGGCRALDDGQLGTLPVAALGQDAGDPVEGGGVLGEHHDPLVAPGAGRAAGRVEELDQRLKAASGRCSYSSPQAISDAMSSLVAALSGAARLLCRSAVNSGCSASPSSSSDCPLPSTSW